MKFLSNITAPSFIRTGGTASQILAADGSVITAGTNITISGGTISAAGGITGTGTTNTLPKFTGTSSIGDSSISDNGTIVTINEDVNISGGGLGIGTSSLTGFNLRIGKALTGATTSYGIESGGVIQSDVTSNAIYFQSSSNTAAASFSTNIRHYQAIQGIFGAGSTVGVQSGFVAESNLTGATTNYGYRGLIPSGTGRWNLYMEGTANNYLAGSLGIGATFLTAHSLRVDKNITGGSVAHGIYNGGIIQSNVLTQARYYTSAASTQAATFTCPDIRHYLATQGTFGTGSTVAVQNGFIVDSTLIGATNNYGFRGQIGSGTGRWNLYMDGTANNHLAGSLGIGSTSLTGYNLRMQKSITGATTSWGMAIESSIQSDVTNIVRVFSSNPTTQATTFTLSSLYHYAASSQTLGAGSTVTTQAGFFAGSGLTTATNNYGFQGDIASGANRWNLYMSGTANNYLAGSLGIGSTTLTGINLSVNKALTGSVFSTGIASQGSVQSDVTSGATGVYSGIGTQATTFTVTNLQHFYAQQGTFGAGSTVTTQHGFRVDSNLTGGTNNYGFRSSIASGSGRYNLFMDGTAQNYLAGNLGIGTTSPSYPLQVNGLISTNRTSNTDGGIVFGSPANGNYIYGADSGSYIATYTSNAERMRINSSGKVLIGKTADDVTGATVQVSGNISFTNSFNTQISNYTLVLGDQCRIIQTDNASANTVTVPTDASVNFPVGTEIAVIQYGAGQTTIVAASGVTIRSKNSYTKIGDRYTGATLVKLGVNDWYLIGNLVA